MAEHWRGTQRDLLDEPSPTGMSLGVAERAKVVKQLEALLVEAMATGGSRREAGDDQDHA